MHCNSHFQEFPALLHIACPSTLLPQLFTKHPPAAFPAHASTPSPPLLRHANSPLPKATYFTPSPRVLPPSHTRTTRMFMQQHERSQKKHVGKPPPPPQPLQTTPSSPPPPLLPPPLTFQKCFEGVKISSLSAKLGLCTQAISAC